MIGLTDPTRPLDRSLLEAPGGFAWWYVDLLDSDHNGCVLIWSFGLPFLPGRESAARAGRPIDPSAQPSLNVCIYERGRPSLYLLQQYAAQDATWEGEGRVRLGRSRLHTRLSGGRRSCSMEVDVDLPGGRRLTGTVELEGAGLRPPGELAHDPRHQWSPLCTASPGSASFDVDGRPFARIRGRAYHDRNGSTAPISSLGIRHWLWGRATAGDEERIWYLLWPESGSPVAWGLEVAPDGSTRVVEALEVRRHGARLGTFGMPWWRDLELLEDGRLWLRVRHRHSVDRGFFYLRWLVETWTPEGVEGVGTAEAVRPGRIDRAWHRWLVRMAVHQTAGANSPFLPWFAGVRRPAARPAIEEVPA